MFWTDCQRGVPQALEAMFSPVADVDVLPYLRAGFRAVGSQVFSTYRRTIGTFWNSGDVKRQRHAWRLAFNLVDLRTAGRFNPQMSPDQIQFVRDMVNRGQSPVDYW